MDGMLALFGATLFLSAFLLFCAEPMVGKLLLPLLGGTPSVWNVCLMFFQGLLLAGYAYAHFLSRGLSPRVQRILHLVLLGTGFLCLPLIIPQGGLPPLPPALALLAMLLRYIGLPFFAVATSGSLLQKWFTESGHPAAEDPYFLYGASNLGSLGALLLYPFLWEAALRLSEQGRVWAAGYGLLLALVALCGVRSLGAHRATAPSPPPLPWKRRLHWCLLATVPSSALLGVTAYLSTDIAAIPLLWVIPLLLYLLTFILAFSWAGRKAPVWPSRMLALTAVPLLVILITGATDPRWLVLPLHLAAFFAACLVCHGALAADRPAASHLTEYYLWIAVGGFLGGAFNALLAPLLFKGIVEYPLALIGAAFFRVASGPQQANRRTDIGLALVVGGAVLLPLLYFQRVPPGRLSNLILFGGPALLCFSYLARVRRFALSLAALGLAGSLYSGAEGRTLLATRNFFGVVRVTTDPAGKYHLLIHGHTLHGQQSQEPSLRREPLAYYTRAGAAGQIFSIYNASGRARRVGLVGLGAGSLFAYAQPKQVWDLYEINPAVAEIARNPRYFTFLGETGGIEQNFILGDARLKLKEAPPGAYGLLVIDAFSSDAIPVHLVTREAIALYRSRLAPRGLLLFHVSNRYLDLKPLLGALAGEEGMAAWSRFDSRVGLDEEGTESGGMEWVIMTGSPRELPEVARDPRWKRLPAGQVAPWTDDYSSFLRLIKW